MTEQTRPVNGTVAEETARLIEAMASMARSSHPRQDTSPYDGGPGQGSGTSGAPHAGDADDRPEAAHTAGACSSCGGERDGIPVACKICPLCQLIALLRSVKPETVDRLADLAAVAAESLRDMATRSRASGPGSAAWSAAGSPTDRAPGRVQDISVDDESEG